MSSGWQRRIRPCTSDFAAVRAVVPVLTCVLGKRGAGREYEARHGHQHETRTANHGRNVATSCHNRIGWTFLLH